jgi:transcriptional antiterminator NusG
MVIDDKQETTPEEAPIESEISKAVEADGSRAEESSSEEKLVEKEAKEKPAGEKAEAKTKTSKRGRKKASGGKAVSGKPAGGKTKSTGASAHAQDESAAENEIEDIESQKDSGPKKKWYVIHTYSGHENKVRDNIMKMIKVSPVKDHFGQLVVPTEEVAEMKKGKKTITTKKFFPSYILIEMHMSDESWHLVNSIPGVTSFVGAGDKPQPLSKQEVERILGRMDKEKQTIIPEIPFTLGEHIRIKDGPFSDFTGVIDEINAEKGKLKVLVSIFGRETPVELDFLQVETI